VRILCPYAPHIAEELWERMGNAPAVSLAPWPAFEKALTIDDVKTIIVQINGKVRSKFQAAAGISKDEMQNLAFTADRVSELIAGKEIVKVIAVPDKIVNIVVK
jgi:leucyl-tRNA synthetase